MPVLVRAGIGEAEPVSSAAPSISPNRKAAAARAKARAGFPAALGSASRARGNEHEMANAVM